MSPTVDLIAFNVVSIFIILVIAMLVKAAIDYRYDPVYALMLSFILGFLGSMCLVLLIKGITPFIQGIHIPLKAFLIIWLVCTVPLVPLIARSLEISGNVLVDSLLVGGGLALAVAIMGTGLYSLLHQGGRSGIVQLWVFIALFMAIAIRAVLWALE